MRAFIFLTASLGWAVSPVAAQSTREYVDDFHIQPSARTGPVPADDAYKPGVMAQMEKTARDPTSLIYEWGDPPRQGWIDLRGTPRYDGLVGCVFVKGKNGFGGYGNWMKFFYAVTPSGQTAILQTWNDQLPPVGKYISHDTGCHHR